MTQPERHSTRVHRCWGLIILADRFSTDWLDQAIRNGFVSLDRMSTGPVSISVSAALRLLYSITFRTGMVTPLRRNGQILQQDTRRRSSRSWFIGHFKRFARA